MSNGDGVSKAAYQVVAHPFKSHPFPTLALLQLTLMLSQYSCRLYGDWEQGHVHKEMETGEGDLGEQQGTSGLQCCPVLKPHREGP